MRSHNEGMGRKPGQDGRKGEPATEGVVCGEALAVLGEMPNHSVDLVYVDPPYFTERDHAGRIRGRNGSENGSDGVATAIGYSDRWQGGRAEYLDWLEKRVREMRRVLRAEAVFLLHLDWHVVHYAKVMCDRVFGDGRFVNELVWYYQTGGASRGRFSRKHDTILMYAKGPRHYFDGAAIAIPRGAGAMKRARSGIGRGSR